MNSKEVKQEIAVGDIFRIEDKKDRSRYYWLITKICRDLQFNKFIVTIADLEEPQSITYIEKDLFEEKINNPVDKTYCKLFNLLEMPEGIYHKYETILWVILDGFLKESFAIWEILLRQGRLELGNQVANWQARIKIDKYYYLGYGHNSQMAIYHAFMIKMNESMFSDRKLTKDID